MVCKEAEPRDGLGMQACLHCAIFFFPGLQPVFKESRSTKQTLK